VPVTVSVYVVELTDSLFVLMRSPQPVASVANRMHIAAASITTIALRRRANPIIGSSRTASKPVSEALQVPGRVFLFNSANGV